MIYFLHPWFLLGLVLGTAPIIIHLWFRRRLRRVEFSSLKFLEAVEREQFNWLRLREILILILRTCAVLLAVGALARPTVRGRVFGANRTASVILIVDDSYSMGRDSLWPAAKHVITELVDSYSKSSEFGIVSLCRPALVDLVDQAEARRIVDRMLLSCRRGRLGPAADLMSQFRPRHPADYLFVTDGQAETFRDVKKPFRLKLSVVRLDAPSDNISLSQMTIEDPVSLVASPIIVAVENHGRQVWSGKVVLSSGPEQEVFVGGGAEARLRFEPKPEEGTLLSAQIDDAALTTDNVRYLVFKPAAARKVLLVHETASGRKFVAKALAPSGIRTPFQIEAVGPPDIKTVNLAAFDGLILSDVGEIGSADAKRIEDYLRQKPVLVLRSEAPGPEFDALLGRAIGRFKPVPVGGFLSVKRLRTEHPVLAGFGLEDFSGAKIFSLCDVEGNRGQVLIWLEEDRPLVIERGNLVVITTALDLDHTDLVYKPAFAPFLHRLLGYMTGDRMVRNKLVGDSLVVKANAGIEVMTPAGREYLVAENGRVVFRNTERPGLYQVGDEPFALNVDPREGDLKNIERPGLDAINAEMVDARQVGRGSDLAPMMLIACLVLLALETVLLVKR